MTRKRPVIKEDFLETKATAVIQESRRLAAWERIQPLLDQPSVHLGHPRPSRDDLHER